jgi:hypothetical protein
MDAPRRKREREVRKTIKRTRIRVNEYTTV